MKFKKKLNDIPRQFSLQYSTGLWQFDHVGIIVWWQYQSTRNINYTAVSPMSNEHRVQ